MIGSKDLKEEIEDGVPFVYINTPTYTQKQAEPRGKVRNIWAFVHKLSQKSMELANRYTPAVVIAASTYPFDCYPARKIAKKAGAALIYEIHDLLPLSLTELHNFKRKSAVVKLIKLSQKSAVKSASAVVSVISHADRYLNELGINVNRYSFIPNGINTQHPETSQHPRAHLDAIKKYKKSGKFVVLYLGDFMEANRVENLITAAKKMTAEIQVVLVGNGADRVDLKKQAAQAHINNVHFLDRVPKVCVQEILSMGDCLYLATKNSVLYDYGLGMNKIYDYLLSGRPIIFATDNEENPVSAAGCGVVVKPEDIDDLIRGIAGLRALSDEERTALGERGRAYCQLNHDYRRIAEQFLEVMKEIVEKE